jgi:tRNA A-37 threonylcarbamoyl transferase component Bud32
MLEPSASALSSPDVGNTLGQRYRVVRRIGEGGMGVVVEAENLVTGKQVAIKWMHPEVAARPHAITRFLREARATARVRHPNVVDVYDVVHDGETCFLVMELLDGEPLSSTLARGGLPAHVLIGYLLDAMRGVLAAHRQGVIHRDIKPDNIQLTVQTDRAHRVPKVLDFGISKVPDADGLSLTRTGTTMGTPMYMSYEQLCGVKDIDVRTDVYAFGVVLYEALTGLPPYPAANLPQLVRKLAHTVPTPPRQLRPEIPEALDALIRRAIAKEREKRTGSLEALIAELEPFASAAAFQIEAPHASRAATHLQPTAAATESPRLPARDLATAPTPMQASAPIPAVPRRRDVLPWLVAIGVIATLIGVLTAYRSWGPQGSAQSEPEALPAASESETKAELPRSPPASDAPVPEVKAPARTGKPDARASTEAVGTRARPTPPVANVARALPPGIDSPSETRVIERPIMLPGQTAAQVPIPATTESYAPPPARDERQFRAGRPRTEDF